MLLLCREQPRLTSMLHADQFHATYAALVIARVAFAFAPGYIHPDEYLQSAEPVASRLGMHARPPWEFGGTSWPIRSWVGPLLTCWIPLRLLHGWRSALLLAVRLPICVTSFGVDAVLVQLCRRRGWPVRPSLLAYAMSWPALVFSSRPFSNTLEAILFAATLFLTLGLPELATPPPSRSVARLLGVLLSVGCWNRFTFAAFWLGAVLGSVRRLGVDWRARALVMAHAAKGAACSALALWALDCHVHGGECAHAPWRCVAPLNALAYNARTANLAVHGLHPRCLHAAVNLPLLLGPLVLPLYSGLLGSTRAALRGGGVGSSGGGIGGGGGGSGGYGAGQLWWWRLWRCANGRDGALVVAMALPMAALSAAPHQEPRFLLPLVLPAALLHGRSLDAAGPRWPRLRWASHASYHAAFALLFGVAHQGGVLRAIRAAGQLTGGGGGEEGGDGGGGSSGDDGEPLWETRLVVVVAHTYPPPHFLLGERPRAAAREDDEAETMVVDVGEAPPAAIAQRLGLEWRRVASSRRVTHRRRRRKAEACAVPPPRHHASTPPPPPLLPPLPVPPLPGECGGASSRLVVPASLSAAVAAELEAVRCAGHWARTWYGWRWRRGRLAMHAPTHSLWPHLSFEALPASAAEAALHIFEVVCECTHDST